VSAATVDSVEPLASGLRLPPAPPRPPAPPSGGDHPPNGGGPSGRPEWSPRARWSLRVWLKESQGEMKRVAWPIHNAVVENSVIVGLGVVVVAGMIAGVDIGLSKLATVLF
jgi:preprotein translocase SecE subunit